MTLRTDVLEERPKSRRATARAEDDTLVDFGARALPVGLSTGQVVCDAFRVLRRIGTGGMSEVYLGRDINLGRLVAIKVMRAPEGATEEQRESLMRLFRRDASATASLSHPGVVTVYHYGVHEGSAYMVLEYVEGKGLDEVLRRGALHERAALDLAIELAQALTYAHGRGVVHRDIKPANVMVDADGHVKLLDFGIALMCGDKVELLERFGCGITTLNDIVGSPPPAAGTPLYMAPEQIRGLLQDERADIWAFGVTLYAMLTASQPYDHPNEVLFGFCVQWPESSTVSARTRDIVERCLKYWRDERPEGFQELLEELRGARAALPLSARPVNEQAKTLEF